MPTRLPAPVFTVDARKMHEIDTRNVENLYSMWTVFNKCAESMEEGRRLENLSWRLWNRETLCCDSRPRFDNPDIDFSSIARQAKDAPSLSSSVASVASEDYEVLRTRSQSPSVEIKRLSSGKSSVDSLSASGKVRAKPISSQALEKMVISIKETKINQKHDMTGLPSYITQALPSAHSASTSSSPFIGHRGSTSTEGQSSSPKRISDVRASQSSASTAVLTSSGSEAASSETSASEISNPAMSSSTGVVRGFTPSSISVHRTPGRPSPAVAMPMKSSLRPKPETSAMKGGKFMLGGSSEDESSSLEEQASRHTGKAVTLQRPRFESKVTSFDEEVKSRKGSNHPPQDEDVFESSDDDEDVESDGEDNEEDDDDDDDDDDEWEDSASESGAASPVEKAPLFQRVDSKPHLVSRRSLLTTMMHQPERANAMATLAAHKSQPNLNLQRSRTSTPNGPSVAGSPEESYLEIQGGGVPRSKPVAMPPPISNTHAALSPRTTRRNMLATELTESLRKHLLWERQQKNTTANAFLKRHHTAPRLDKMADMRNQTTNASGTGSKTNSWNNYFDHGLGEYHQKGW